MFFTVAIYIKVVISVCLFACPIITHEPRDRFASNWVTHENHRNVLSYEILNLMGPPLKEKKAKIVIYDKARVNGRSNSEFSGQCWVLKLILVYVSVHTGLKCECRPRNYEASSTHFILYYNCV